MFLFKRLIPPVAVVLWMVATCTAQQPSPSSEVKQLRTELAATQSELQQYKQELAELREQLRAVQQHLGMSSQATPGAEAKAGGTQFPTLADVSQEPAPAPAATDQDLVAAKVAEYEQTKVESVSKYKVRLSGMVLMNTYTNFGNVDVTDLPNLAFRRNPAATGGDAGATLRQTSLGLQVTGPTVAGARTSADVDIDFYGGIPQTNYGVSMGVVRLRTARARLDWRNWSLVAGQDSPLFSPLSPTSYASLAEPAMSWSGNLWVWQPQIRAERRWNVSEKSTVAWTFGIIDPLTEEPPDAAFNRRPDPGEATRVPGLGSHLSWTGNVHDQPATLGFGGYYGRQNWGFSKQIDSWAVAADFDLPFTRWLALSGEVYRGQALGGFGGGIWASAVFDGNPDLSPTHVLPLNDIGGWSQLKFKPLAKLEFNTVAGTANPFSKDLEFFAKPRTYAYTPLARNQTLLFNSIYHPRSNVLFAVEYRHLRTYGLTGTKNTADHVNLSIGVSF